MDALVFQSVLELSFSTHISYTALESKFECRKLLKMWAKGRILIMGQNIEKKTVEIQIIMCLMGSQYGLVTYCSLIPFIIIQTCKVLEGKMFVQTIHIHQNGA